MTEQTQPKDAEIEAIWSAVSTSSIWPGYEDLLAFARAVLAKWGTPAGAGEVPGPVRLRFFRDMTEDQRLLVFKVFGVLPEGAESQADTHHVQGLLLKAMYRQLTTPQPTQAQAGAPRVSPEQWQALFDDQKRLVELANSRADIAESMLKAVQVQAGTDAVVEEVANGLRRYGLTLVKTASGYDVLSLREVAAHDTKGADHA